MGNGAIGTASGHRAHLRLHLSPSDFWHRWHISLSTWLRDYLYIPLGGNRFGRWIEYRNLMITMTLGGLWHGAGILFVLWGIWHGLLLVLYRLVPFDRYLATWFGSVSWTHDNGVAAVNLNS